MYWTILAYPLTLAGLFALVYLFFLWLFPIFFNQKPSPLSRRNFISLGIIFVLSLAIWLLTRDMANQELANRLLHALGGGALGTLTCYLATKDSKVNITTFQFFIFSFLLVTALGVGNELLEFFLQETTGEIFSNSNIDAWLDLASNTVGALLASAVFVPIFSKLKK